MIETILKKFIPRIEARIAEDIRGLSRISPAKVAAEMLDTERIREQYALLERYCGPVAGKNLLEIGSGYGLFTAYGNKFLGCRVEGVEAAENEFSSTYEISRELLASFELDPHLIRLGVGEALPYPEESLDMVYSSNVLEHVSDPKRVIAESIRVLKPGGYLQVVVPNYGSFWEGHYCIFWPPYLTPALAKVYVRLFGKNADFVNRLRFINYFMLQKILKPYLETKSVTVLTWGENIFKERMETLQFSSWAGLGMVKRWVEAAHQLRLIGFVTQTMIAAKAFTPIVLTLRKEKSQVKS